MLAIPATAFPTCFLTIDDGEARHANNASLI